MPAGAAAGSPSAAPRTSDRRLRTLAMLLIVLLLAGGCGRVPKIIVLEDPLSAVEHVELGVAYERKGELDLAQREYEAALRKDRKSFQARVNLGNVFLAKKEYEKARGEYLRALELAPGNPEAANNLAWCAILSGEGNDEALTRMEGAVSAPGGRRPAFLDTLGVLRMRANRPKQAAAAFDEAEKLCRESAPADCPAEVRKEIEDHRKELLIRFPIPAAPPPLIK